MRAIWNIALLSIRLALQNTGTYLTFFVMPIAMMFLLTLAFGNPEPILRLDVVNNDVDAEGQPSALSQEFITQLEAVAEEGETVVICLYGSDDNPERCNLDEDDSFEDEGESRLLENDAAGIMIIPAGFEAELLGGQSITLTYQSDEGLNAGTVTRTTVETAAGRISSSVAIARIATETAETVLNAPNQGEAFPALRQQAQTALNNPPALLNQVSTQEGNEDTVSGQGQSVPGIASMFVLIAMLTLAADLVSERSRGTLQRLFVLPTPKFNIVAGKILGRYLFGILQFAIFIWVGVMMGVNWGDNFPAILMVAFSFTLTATTLGFLLSTLVRTPDQAATIATMMGLLLAPIGGAWWPLEIVPDFMQTVALISPIRWAMVGFQDVLFYNGGVAEVLPEVAFMLVLSLVATGLAVWNFRYE